MPDTFLSDGISISPKPIIVEKRDLAWRGLRPTSFDVLKVLC
jgi:hypothetical protein